MIEGRSRWAYNSLCVALAVILAVWTFGLGGADVIASWFESLALSPR